MTDDTEKSPHATQFDEADIADLGMKILENLGPMIKIMVLIQELREEFEKAHLLGPNLVRDTREVLEIGNALCWRDRALWDPDDEDGREIIAEIAEGEGWLPKGFFPGHDPRRRRRKRRAAL